MMDTRDAEHELNVEISENDVRKGFTKSERVDYMKRLLRIEQTKAKERMSEGGKGVENATAIKRSDEATAKQFEVSAKTMRREIAISDNRELLDLSDFTEWDEGRLSTNKAYQKLKQKEAEREKENASLRQENAELKTALEEAQEISTALLAAEQRIGEILLEIPKQAGRPAVNNFSTRTEKLKSETIAEMGYSKDEVSDYQQMAKNPDIVNRVISAALEAGEIVTA